jgi:hypothetical protein
MPFSFTESSYNKILRRLTALESLANDILVALKRLASLQQVNELLVITQAKISALESTVNSLEERVTAIEEEPMK